MKVWLLYIVTLVLVAALPENGWAVEDPVGRGTVPPSSRPRGRGTVPPSSLRSGRSGLIRSPNPIDTRSNLVVTGNVGSGRHFRGVVPYRSTSEFGAPTGSSLLDSFLRRSIGSPGAERYTGTYETYYSQTRTVTTTRPGLSGVFRPPTARLTGRSVVTPALPPLPSPSTGISGPRAAVSPRDLRPMAMTPLQMEKMISAELDTYSQSETLTDEQRQERVEQFRRDVKHISDKAAELERNLIRRGAPSRLLAESEPDTGILQPLQPQKTLTPHKALTPQTSTTLEQLQTPAVTTEKLDTQLDVYEQMRQQAGLFQKTLEPLPAEQQDEEAADGEEEPGEESPKSSLLGELSDVVLAARAKDVLGEHETFASFSKDKFNQHLRAGEEFLKRGKYYLAADAYTLASLYKPSDPLAYAGKSHALFAAGEYMSSALFLSRALEIFPEYARFKIDIEAMIGDRDRLETRVADVERWQEKSNAAELQFLLAYVYYQMGRVQRAKGAVNAVYEKMPQAPAVIALKRAIEIADSR